MIPEFLPSGNLPPGIHDVSWQDFCERFGHTAHRKSLLDGLASALKDLSVAGCKVVYIDGSFVTNKEVPGDYDLCWSIDSVVPEKLNWVLLDFSPPGRTKMKDQYR